MTYQSPGVYIEEVPSGPQPVAAASTSVLAIIGNTRKGPLLKPTRITGWSDFVRTFGAAHRDGFTAESLYGFFENGGPAAWVVRVDPSTTASWRVSDSTPNTSFEVVAASAGSWANALDIAVTPDTSGGAGSLFSTVITADVELSGATATDIAVASSAGARVNDLGVVISRDGVAKAVRVEAVAGDTLTVTKTEAGTVSLVAGDVFALRADAGATQVTFAAGSGFKAHDVLVAELPTGARVFSTVSAVAPSGAGLALTLTGLSGDAPGSAVAKRRTTYKGDITGGTDSVALSDVTWAFAAGLAPTVDSTRGTNARATFSNGAVSEYSNTTDTFPVPGGHAPAGPVTVEAELRVTTLSDPVVLDNPSPADVQALYPFLPPHSSVELTNGTDTAVITYAAGVPTVTGSLAAIFTTARIRMPQNLVDGVVVRAVTAPRVGDFIEVLASRERIASVTAQGGTVYTLGFDAATAFGAAPIAAANSFPLWAFGSTKVFPMRFSVAVTDAGVQVEEFSSLSLDPEHPSYYARDGVINGTSAFVTVSPRATGAPAISLDATPASVALKQPAADALPQTGDYKQGLTALELQTEPAMVAIPDTVTFDDPLMQADLVGALVTHCENFRRFAIVDPPNEPDDTELLAWRNTTLSSTYAAVFAPHLDIVSIDPNPPTRFRTVPPSGFVAGVFARTDRERGVHKAPGNERVAGIVGLSESYTQRRQDLLNPSSVNLIRAFRGRGTRVWGARTATDDATWRYINVRRLFNMIETSVDQSTQWVVFEPNTASTWMRVKVSVENFLDQLWRSGALAGSTPEQAYRVRIGLGETMTETDVDLGLIITEVALAPAKPAEFVVFRFSHKRLSE